MTPAAPHRRASRLAGLALAAALYGPAAQAQLFSDDEARKAVLELRGRFAQAEEAEKARFAQVQAAQAQLQAAQAQLGEELAALRRSLLELNNQIESLRGELARQRGGGEQLAREVADVQRRQRDIAQALDDRLRRIEPVKASVDGQDFMASAEEKKAYEEAMSVLRGGDFEQAAAALALFQRRYPASGYFDSARFWHGNALYGKRDYKEAVAAFRAFVTATPQHPRAPEALLALANSQIEMKDARTARRTLEELLKAYPGTEAAQAGKERLGTLK